MRPRAAAASLALPLLSAGALLSCAPAPEPPPVFYEAPDFALVDQTGDTLRAEEYRGRVWVAGFIFTRCEDVCPLISARMAELRDSLAGEGLLGTEVRLVSITVDPARDTPDVLADYAAAFGGSPPAEWAFLTGSPPERVRDLVQEGFLVSALLPPDAGESYQVTHSPRLLLVDRDGWVRGSYIATEPEALQELLANLRAILR